MLKTEQTLLFIEATFLLKNIYEIFKFIISRVRNPTNRCRIAGLFLLLDGFLCLKKDVNVFNTRHQGRLAPRGSIMVVAFDRCLGLAKWTTCRFFEVSK